MRLHFSRMYFKWNILVCDHEEGTVGFPECKPLSRSSANYADSDSTLRIIKYPQAWMCQYTGCNRRKGPDFGRVFLMLNYTEKPQNTYIQS